MSTGMLSPKQAAARIGISHSLIYQLCSENLLPHYRFGAGGKRGRLLIKPDDLDAFVESCRRTPDRHPLTLKHINLA